MIIPIIKGGRQYTSITLTNVLKLVISSYCLYDMISWISSNNMTGIFCPDNLGQQKSKRDIKSSLSVNQGRQDGKKW